MSELTMPDIELLKGKKVLLADDLDACRVLGAMFLNVAGIEVEVVTNGIEAFKKALNEKFDAILMDIHMPFNDGLSVIEQLREKGVKSPVVVVSSDCRSEVKERAFEVGASNFIAKPLTLKSLVQSLSQVFSKNNDDRARRDQTGAKNHFPGDTFG